MEELTEHRRLVAFGLSFLRACPKIARGPAARDFGCGQGGEVRASPTRAVRTEPTQATDKRPAARRVFAPKAAWLRCSSVEDPGRIFSFVAPRHPAFGAKTGPRGIFGHALSNLSIAHRVPPHPGPLPQGEGKIVGHAGACPGALDCRTRDNTFSLSQRERAGVRGNAAFNPPMKIDTEKRAEPALPVFAARRCH